MNKMNSDNMAAAQLINNDPESSSKQQEAFNARIDEITELIEKLTVNNNSSSGNELLPAIEDHMSQLKLLHSKMVDDSSALSAKLEYFYTLYENAPVGYIIIDPGYTILTANKKAHQLFPAATASMTRTSLLDYFNTSLLDGLLEYLQLTFAGQKTGTCYISPAHDSSKAYALTCNLETDNHNQPVAVRVIVKDVTETELTKSILYNYKKNLERAVNERTESLLLTNKELLQQINLRQQTERKLLQSEDKYRQLFATMEQGVALHKIILDEEGKPADYRFIETNASFEKATGLKNNEIIGKTVRELLPDLDASWIERYGKVALTGEPVEFEDFVPSLNRFFSVSAYRPYEQHFVVVVTNITQRKEMEKAKAASELLYRTLIETSGDGIIVTDLQGVTLFANKQKAELHKYNSPDEIIGVNVFEHFAEEVRPAVFQLLGQLMQTGKVFFESVAMDKFGEKFPVEVSSKIIYNQEGNPSQIMSTVRNITERKRTEELIKQSLREKEVLIKEIHHRVKNNFQVITSLLNLQANVISDEKIVEVLGISRNRIKAMSIVHELMYQTKNFEKISVKSYISNLIGFLRNTFSTNTIPVDVRLNISDTHLSIDQMSPCGLILNELVTNAFKHAYSGISSPVLEITLLETDENHMNMCVKDNGKGLPENYVVDDNNTLGLPLVSALSEQLGGKLSMESSPSGSVFSIPFVRK
ncbi:MAG: PAS domain S-box protein [Ignavibacteriales bacterium]|nr:PAS domain S-box protein [Ignavibacteriales bacterium]